MRKYFEELAAEVKAEHPNSWQLFAINSIPLSLHRPIIYVGTHIFASVSEGGSYSNNGPHYVTGRVHISYTQNQSRTEREKYQVVLNELMDASDNLDHMLRLPRSDKQARDLVEKIKVYDSMIGQLLPRAELIVQEREKVAAREKVERDRIRAIENAAPSLFQAVEAFLRTPAAQAMSGEEIDEMRAQVAALAG